MRFKDRNDAARKLIPYLEKYRNEKAVILAVPRGGVPIAYLISKTYNFPLELLMTKKIGHPFLPEYAIGAVSLDDHIIDNQFIDDQLGVPHSYIDSELVRIRASLQERYKIFMGDHKPIDIQNKLVIIVDDGVATGNTILSTINMLRRSKPAKIVVAVPVAPPEVAKKIMQQVDEFICLYTPQPFIGVGLHYKNFTQVSDEEVIHLLRDANRIESAA